VNENGEVSKNAKTGLILATVALVFFFGIIVKYWLMGRA
jgi:hypothetical protein